ncbi:hypothetical protein GW17_00046120, partial [Ensete ventricosum]
YNREGSLHKRPKEAGKPDPDHEGLDDQRWVRIANGPDFVCETGEVLAEVFLLLLLHPEEGCGGWLWLDAGEKVTLELPCELIERVKGGGWQPIVWEGMFLSPNEGSASGGRRVPPRLVVSREGHPPQLIDVERSCDIDDPPYSAKCCGCSIASKESTQRDSGREYKRGPTHVVRGQRVRMLSSSCHFVAGPNVVDAPPRPGSTHNEVQATSIRGAPCRQFEVGVCGCSAQVVTLMRVLLTSPKCSYKTRPSLGWWVPGEVPLTIKLGLFRMVKSGVSCSEAGAFSLLIEVERER